MNEEIGRELFMKTIALKNPIWRKMDFEKHHQKHLQRKSKPFKQDFRAKFFARFQHEHLQFPKQGGFSAESKTWTDPAAQEFQVA